MSDAVGLSAAPMHPAPDVYFDAAYGRLDAATSGGEWYEVGRSDGAWSLPVVERPVAGGAKVGSSPYGYSGIRVAPDLGPVAAGRAWTAAVDVMRDRGIVSLFLRFHPLDAASSRVAAGFPGIEVVRTSGTYAATIQDTDIMWTGLEGRARTEVRKAQRAGMSADVSTATAADLQTGSPFRELYEGTMRRVAAAGHYYFDDQYYSSLASLPRTQVRIVQVRLEGEVVAAAIILVHGDRAHYHLSGSQRSAARLGANSLLLWTVMTWCAEQGARVLHLGGGVTEDDGLARFKRSFGDQRLDFLTGRAVIDPARYADLTARRAAELGCPVEALTTTGYFPAFLAEV